MASLTDNLNWKGYSEIEQLRITEFLCPEFLWDRCFPMNFGKTFKNTYLEEYLWTTAFGYRLQNYVETEPQRFTAFTFSCLHQHLCR